MNFRRVRERLRGRERGRIAGAIRRYIKRFNQMLSGGDRPDKELKSQVAKLAHRLRTVTDMYEILLKVESEEMVRLEEMYAARLDQLEEELSALRLRREQQQQTGAPVANRLHDLLKRLLDLYETSGGISADAYCDTPQWHAMAEAQYLEALTIARSAGLLSQARAAQCAAAAVARLRDGALRREAGGYAQWGLGFGWQQFAADEPFLVTSALVTRALIGARDLVGCDDLAREGLVGLARMPRVELPDAEQPLALPVYAPSLHEAVDNAVALWAQAVSAGSSLSPPGPELQGEIRRALEWLDRRFVPGLGWAHSATRPVFELIHQVYILEGLGCHPGTTEREERAIEVFAGFRCGAGYIDSLTLTTRDKALESAVRSGAHYPVFRGEHVLSARTDPARLWSLGAMLGVFGGFALEGTRRGYWLSQIRRFPLHMLPDRFGIDFRQEMHLARGAALALKALRG